MAHTSLPPKEEHPQFSFILSVLVGDASVNFIVVEEVHRSGGVGGRIRGVVVGGDKEEVEVAVGGGDVGVERVARM